MDAHVSGTLTKAGEKAKETSESVTHNFNKPGTYVVFSGVKKASGYGKAKTCNSSGTGWSKEGHGKAHSWGREPRPRSVRRWDRSIEGFP
ncbi:hypothetical protein ACFZCV_32765 [Streptomyces sp. NPDC007920]|uniref:hypothetical protein n=1 Tax=Streptomyces sp. NPDC007920 TaxID=3364794 RepID=UPI0036E804F6